MNGIELRPADVCRHDVVTLGEVMLRLDPGEGRVRSTRSFTVSEGGGEYNVGRALHRCFEHRVAHVTAIGRNDVGRLLEDLMLQGGVNLDHIVWKDADEIGRWGRNPLNFTERGFGMRSARSTYDRAHSATGALKPSDIDWDHLFGEVGARWLHTGGIFAGLSPATFETAQAAMAAARRHGTVVSYDINYRPSLWAASGGAQAAERLTAELLDHVDVLFGVDDSTLETVATQLADKHPGLTMVAAPKRKVHSASQNDWSGRAWSRADGLIDGLRLDALDIFDRVGGGDGFASGVIHGLLTDHPLSAALNLGIAHGALVMTTPGDTSMADLGEVNHLAAGGDAGVIR